MRLLCEVPLALDTPRDTRTKLTFRRSSKTCCGRDDVEREACYDGGGSNFFGPKHISDRPRSSGIVPKVLFYRLVSLYPTMGYGMFSRPSTTEVSH